MPSYLVTWEIDIKADSYREAAEEAFRIMQEPGTEATCFNVMHYADQSQEYIDLEVLEADEG